MVARHKLRHGTYRKSAKTLDMRPTARILFLITLRRSLASSEGVGEMSVSSSELSSSSSFVQQLSIANSMSVTIDAASTKPASLTKID